MQLTLFDAGYIIIIHFSFLLQIKLRNEKLDLFIVMWLNVSRLSPRARHVYVNFK